MLQASDDFHASSSFVLCTKASGLTILEQAQPASCAQWKAGTISSECCCVLVLTCESSENDTLGLDAVPQGQSDQRDYLRTENGKKGKKMARSLWKAMGSGWRESRKTWRACIGMGEAWEQILSQQKAFWNNRLVLGLNWIPPGTSCLTEHRGRIINMQLQSNSYFKNVFEGPVDGLVGKRACLQDWGPEFDPQGTHGGRRDSILESCPLTPT